MASRALPFTTFDSREASDADGLSPGQVIALPAFLCGLSVLFALISTWIARVQYSDLLIPYFATSAAVTTICVLLSVFWWVLKLGLGKVAQPLPIVVGKLRNRAPYLLLPCVVFPLFLVAYTAAKTSIPFVVGYSWDGFFAQADQLLFRDDPWRIAHRWLGEDYVAVWQWFYTAAWGGALIFTSALIPMNAKSALIGRFYSALIGSWFVGGVCLAYGFSAAGPVFAQLSNPSLAAHFDPLRQLLERKLGTHGPIGFTQHYLLKVVTLHVATKGGGISAMPSMHLAAASVYVLAARRTKWFFPSLVFWGLIFTCSAYFGYHYWMDGIVAAVVAVLAWSAADIWYGRVESDRMESRSPRVASV